MYADRLNAIPRALAPLISFAIRAVDGAKMYGAAIGLRQNSADWLAADLEALIGASGEEEVRGGQGRLSAALTDEAAARRALRAARKAAQAFCASTVDLLKSRYGRKWNARWAEAGFAWGTLRIPYDPVARLLDLRGYFLAHPEHEVGELKISAARCEELLEALGAARTAADGGKASAFAARRGRNAAKRRLQKRLTSLRQELEFLLSPDDERWLQFGFRRPAGGRTPGEVQELHAETLAAGEVRLSWRAASRAKNYRVTWRGAEAADSADGETTDEGLFADCATVVRDLPEGREVAFRVSARNAAGESAAAEVRVKLPGGGGATPGAPTADR